MIEKIVRQAMEVVEEEVSFTIEPEEDEGMPVRDDALDDLVVEVQDAFFEGRYKRAIELAARVLLQHPKEEDTYDMLLASHLALCAACRCDSCCTRSRRPTCWAA